MKNYKYIALGLLLIAGLTSCNKEEITMDEPEVILDPPEEIQYAVARGVVKDEDGILADVKILVYQEGNLIGETYSNADGEYSTIDIETSVGEDLILEFTKEEYNTSFRKRSGDNLKSALDVELINSKDVYGNPSSIPVPDAEEFVSLSGYIKDLDDGPSRARVIIEYMKDGVNFVSTTLSDSDGYYELLIAKDIEIGISIFSDTICFAYLTEQDTTILSNLKAEIIGGFSEDVILDDYVNPYVTARVFEIAGQVNKCNGEDATFSRVRISINDFQDHWYIYENVCETDGTFTFEENQCISIPYRVKIVGFDESGNMHSDTTIIEVSNAEYTNYDIELTACNLTESDYSTATMNVDGTEYNFNQIPTRIENGGLTSDEYSLSYGLFTIPNIALGDVEIHSLELGNWDPAYLFKAENDIMIANVSSLSSSSATVTVTGPFIFNNTTTVVGTCTLNLKF